jgi:uncharacterized membrane protein YeaQ/YmgE (transglycosylase-associated protein family)
VRAGGWAAGCGEDTEQEGEKQMNPSYGIIMWVIVGALAGWLGSKIMGTDSQQGGLANVIIGVIGAVVGGFVTRAFFGDNPGHTGFIASLLVAILGAVILLGLYKALVGRRVVR